MFTKSGEEPLQLTMEKALLTLIPKNHEKYKEIEVNYKKNNAGYKGELELDYHLNFIPNHYYIIPGVRLLNDVKQYFQVDTLIISSKFAIIIESKSMYGELHFDSISGQVTRKSEYFTGGIPNPILQAQRQKVQFQQWFNNHFQKEIPCYHLVSIRSPETILHGPSSIFKYVYHAEQIPNKIDALSVNHTKEIVTPYIRKKLLSLIKEQHTPAPFDAMEFYNLQKSDLMNGITCPNCNQDILKRQSSTWFCNRCLFHSKNAHIHIINSYLSIFPSISVKECQTLLRLSSRFIARRLLIGMNLLPKNQRKSTTYIKPK
ncbi:nuclease-related domain-containing protein [Bacillus carboniphilus]|uniref:Nuclease-related domain-containing protein n=1 Tax=Bacillus carboniphilus TaxID=86663 RepID=A0ABN0VPC6_9BACI